MPHAKGFLRYASPNEQRTISREDLGLYNRVLVGGIYMLPRHFLVDQKQSYFPALHKYIARDPYTSITVGDSHTSKSFYSRVSKIDLEQHVQILDPSLHIHDETESELLDRVVLSHLDRSWPESIPPWNLIVLPLEERRAFLAFIFSHIIGDGIVGLSVHRCILDTMTDGLSTPSSSSKIMVPEAPLPEPFDTVSRLPISWSFLLRPLLTHYLPASIVTLLLGSAPGGAVNDATWLGRPVNASATSADTCMQSLTVSADVLSGLLTVVRKEGVKLTGLLHQVIARAFSGSLQDHSCQNFLAETAINLRGVLNQDVDEPGQWTSVIYESLSRPAADGSRSIDWQAAQATTASLARCSRTAQDQPIALLRYLSDIRAWLISKGGKSRDCSYGLSNLGSFDGRDHIESMIFAQPGPVSGPVCFINAVSVKDGSLTLTINWSSGTLGVPLPQSESDLIGNVLDAIRRDLYALQPDVDT